MDWQTRWKILREHFIEFLIVLIELLFSLRDRIRLLDLFSQLIAEKFIDLFYNIY